VRLISSPIYYKDRFVEEHIIHKMKRKNRMETICTILNLSTDGIKKSRINYRARLNRLKLDNYLDVLVSLRLLEKKIDSYKTTRRGLKFTKRYREIQALMKEIEI
jgi:predicted transcriptional regulator